MKNTLEKINKASLRLLEPLEAEDMYKTIIEEAKSLTLGHAGIIQIEKNDELERVFSSANVINTTKVRKRGFTYKAYKNNKLTILDSTILKQIHSQLYDRGLQQAVLIPLSYKGRSIGVVTIQLIKSREFSEQEIEGLRLFGSLASLAIRKTQLYEEQRKSLEVRDLFISLASHELRTPLTSINGYIQLLYSKLGKQETSEGKWIRELVDESQRLTNLVKELLEINRIRQGQFQFSFTEVKVVDIIQKAVERLLIIHKDRQIVVSNKITSSDNIIGDPDKLLQMMTAIIENAIKFSPSIFNIEVEIKERKKHVVISVTDKGVGIKDEDLQRVLEGFYKGSQQEKEGIGVGLVMARHIIQAHHGGIVMRSKPKKGTEVTITLPKAKL